MGTCASSKKPSRRSGTQPEARQNEMEAYGSRVTVDVNEIGNKSAAKIDKTDEDTDEDDRPLQSAEREEVENPEDKDNKVDDDEKDDNEEEEEKEEEDEEEKEEEQENNEEEDEEPEPQEEEEPEEAAVDEEDEEDEEDEDEENDAWWYGTDTDEMTRQIIEGNIDMEIPSQVKLVRIFTSSTFTDTFTERNNLMERIYPKLKEYCQSLGYDFQVVDMRWGVRDEATDDHMTSELCMRELRACQKLSTGPNFITFLGQKYGYRPFPPKIAHSEFEAMLGAVSKESDKALLAKWFKRDDNLVPAMYILQPIRKLIPHYNNREASDEERKQASGEWWNAFETMQVILRNASKEALSDQEEIAKYRISVTEDEIRRGILRVKDKDKHCYWFKRNIADLHERLDKGKARMFIDKAGDGLDKEAVSLLDKLRNNLKAKLSDSSVTEYDVKWSGEQCIEPQGNADHKAYIDKLCKDFYDTLVQMINRGIEEKKRGTIDDELVKEVSLHSTTCKDKSRVFYGREAVIDAIVQHIDDESEDRKRVLVVHGASGCGKTSIMAVAAKKIKDNHPDYPVILRFLGTTSESSSINKALYSICKQLCYFIGKKQSDIPVSFKKMADFFTEQLRDIESKIVIMLDSLDQLSPEDGALNMKWLPKDISSNVSIILSTLPGEEYKVLPALKNQLPANAFVEVPVMPQDTASLILDAWLKDVNHTLTQQQIDLVMNAFNGCPLPLFLKLSSDEAVRWKSYSAIEKCILKSTVKDSINALFERLERLHGYQLVSHGLAYITAAKNGLSDAELDDILSIDDDVLNDVYQYWTPPVRRIPPLLWIRVKTDLGSYVVSRGADGVLVNTWYHRQFIETARERYVRPDNEVEVHEVLADYFLGKWSGGVAKPFTSKKGDKDEKDRHAPGQPNIFAKKDEKAKIVYNYRKLSELPRHLIKSRNLQALKDHVIFNFDFLSAKICALGLRSLMQDFNEALEVFKNEREIKLLRDCIQMSAKGLLGDPNQLAAQLNARLSKSKDHETINDLLDQSKRANVPCLYPSVPCFEKPGGPLVHSLAGHTSAVQWASLTKDGKRLISVAQNNVMKLWDMDSGEEIRSYDVSSSYTVARFYNDEKGVILAGFTGFVAMDLETEEIAYQEEYLVGMYGTCMDILANGTRIVHASNDKISVFEINGKDVKPCWSYDATAVADDSGFYDTICGGGNFYAYTRGNMRELTIRKGDDKDFVKKLKVPYRLMHYKFDEDGSQLIALGSNSKMTETYKQVNLTIWDTSSWNIVKDSESKFDAMLINVHDMAIAKLAKGWEVIWPVIFQINFWNLNTGVERVALKSGYQGNQYKQAICADGHHLVVVSMDTNQRAIHVYDLNAIDYVVGGDKHLSAIDKTKAYVGEGEREVYFAPDNPKVVLSIPPAEPVITIWDVHHQDRLRRVRTEGIFPSAFQYINERHMAVWDHNTRKVFLLDYINEKIDGVISGKICETPPTTAHSNTWQLINSYELVAVSEDSKDINRWDLKTGELMNTIKIGDKHGIASMLVSEDKSMALLASKDYSGTNVPAICVDLKQNKKIGQVAIEGQRVGLAPENTLLSPNGEHLIMAMHQNVLQVFDTRAGKKKQDIHFTRKDKPSAAELGYDIDDSNLFQCITGSAKASYIACCVSGTQYVNGTYEQCCWLVCYDFTTLELLGYAICYYYMKMSASKDGSRLIALSQPLGEESKALDLWDMSQVRKGKLTLLGKFLPETDVRFSHLTPDGNAVVVGIAGISEVIFLRVCGDEWKKEREEDCQESKIVVDPEQYKK